MSEQEYQTLWHYSEILKRDKLQRSELITMAWKAGEKMGKKRSVGLMQSHMHYRNRELNFRSAFPGDEMGKSQKDAWNKSERVYLDRCAAKDGEGQTLGDLFVLNRTTPLDFTITNDFLESLSDAETAVIEDLAAGYNCKEIAQRQHVSYPMVQSIRKAVQEKAVEYL